MLFDQNFTKFIIMSLIMFKIWLLYYNKANSEKSFYRKVSNLKFLNSLHFTARGLEICSNDFVMSDFNLF